MVVLNTKKAPKWDKALIIEPWASPHRTRVSYLELEAGNVLVEAIFRFLGWGGENMPNLTPLNTMLGFPLRDFHLHQAWFRPEFESRQLRYLRYPLSGYQYSCARKPKFLQFSYMRRLPKSWFCESLEPPNKFVYVRWNISFEKIHLVVKFYG